MPKPVKWLIGGCIGGAIGAAIWAGISYATGYEIGWIAWGVGVLVGIGVRIGSPNSSGVGPGLVAAVIALVSLLGGRYASITLAVEKQLAAFEANMDDIILPAGEERVDIAISKVVAERMQVWESEGKTIPDIDQESLPDDAPLKEFYPPELWQEGETAWNELSTDEQEAMLQEVDEDFQLLLDENLNLAGKVRDEAFANSFEPIDLLFAVLALFSAFKIGGAMDEE